MNEDLSKLEDGLGEKVVIFAHFFISFVGSIITAFIKGWLMTLVCLVSLPVTLISMSIVAVVCEYFKFLFAFTIDFQLDDGRLGSDQLRN